MKRRGRRPAGSHGLHPLILAALLGALAALWTWTASGDPALRPASDHAPGVMIHIRDNGFHTDIALPRADLEARPGPLAEAVRALPPGDRVMVGWGDARFFVDQRPIQDRLPDGFRAFFFRNNASVVMLDPDTEEPGAGEVELRLSAAGFEAMTRHIEASLALKDGRPMLAAARPGDDTRFYASREHFWIGHLCNHWTTGALNAAGLSTHPFRSITSSEVMATVRRVELDRPRPEA